MLTIIVFAVVASVIASVITTVVITAIVIATMVIPAVAAIIISVIVTIMVTCTLLVARGVLLLVPIVPDKINPLAAGVVTAAISGPIFGMARRNIQINRRTIR